VFDAWPFMAEFEDEPSADTVDSLLRTALELDIPLMITSINLGEIWYNLAVGTQSKKQISASTKYEKLVFKS
jgi:hypothetical protein